MKKRPILTVVLFSCVWALSFSPASAWEFDLGKDQTIDVLGSLSNQLQFSVRGDFWDTEEDLNQWLTTLQLLADYRPRHDLSFYISGKLAIDWIYDIKHNDRSWLRKGFNESRDNLYFDDEWWMLLNEFHVTYTPGPFLFRVGKQLVKWGEMEGAVVLDQINPVDLRRQITFVEFESYFIATPMVRLEYWPELFSNWFSSPNIQFLFIPNSPYIPSIPPGGIYFGNTVGGIYSYADVTDGERFGRADFFIDEPDSWDPDYFEYALKLSTQIEGNILSLYGFYGRENLPVLNLDLSKPGYSFPIIGPISIPTYTGLTADSYTQVDDEGHPIYNLLLQGYYPIQKFVGLSWSSSLEFARFYPIGGTAPLFRLETLYQFDKVYADENFANDYLDNYGYVGELIFGPTPTTDAFVKTDWWMIGVSLEQKFRWLSLQKAYFTVSLEYTYEKVLDHQAGWSFQEDGETFLVYIYTSYFNGKLAPEIYYQYVKDGFISGTAHQIWPGVYYYLSDVWDFYAGFGIFEGKGASPITKKDYFLFRVNYNF